MTLDDGTAECPLHPGMRGGYYTPKVKDAKVQPWCPLCRRARRPSRLHLVTGYIDLTHTLCACGWPDCPDIVRDA